MIELSAGFLDMENEIDKMATTFLDLIGLQSSKTTATSNFHVHMTHQSIFYLVKGLSLAFLGLLCKYFPEHMRKYSDPLLLGQYLKYLHEQVCTTKLDHCIELILIDASSSAMLSNSKC